METLVRINNQTAGRDKIARLLQYLSRVLWYRIQQNKERILLSTLFSKNTEAVNGLKNLEFQLSTFRKLLRFGKCLDVFYSLICFNHSNETVKNLIISSKIASSLFLLTDHFLWLGRADVCSINTQKWSGISNKYWLFSITMNLVRDFYEISRLISDQKQEIFCGKAANCQTSLTKAITLILNNRSIMIDTVKNACDFFIPLTALGHVNLSPGTVGWLGVVSSIVGLVELIDPKMKLSPS